MVRRPPRKSADNPGRVLRPKAEVLSDDALVPARNRIQPPPNQFTHELTQSQPYYYDDPRGAAAGTYAVGTRVVLMVHEGDPFCRVADAQGLYVQTSYEGLRRL